MIFKGETTCENCSHRRVCNMRNDLTLAKQEADKVMEKVIDTIEITIRCKEFREDIAVRTPFGGSK